MTLPIETRVAILRLLGYTCPECDSSDCRWLEELAESIDEIDLAIDIANKRTALAQIYHMLTEHGVPIHSIDTAHLSMINDCDATYH